MFYFTECERVIILQMAGIVQPTSRDVSVAKLPQSVLNNTFVNCVVFVSAHMFDVDFYTLTLTVNR